MAKQWILQYHFVAFIDVLGQSNKLLSLRSLPFTQNEQTKAQHILHDTAGFIMNLRNGFKEFFEARNRPTGKLNSLSPQRRAIADKLRRCEVNIASFSDTIIITLPISNEDEHCLSISSIYSALYGLCGIFLVALAEKKPLRCGIDIGIGVHLDKDEIYGSALVKAYHLENEAAQYPRVVIGDDLWNYLHYIADHSSNSIYGTWAKRTAINCIALITEDQDSLHILDVAGEGVKSIEEGVDSGLIEKGYRFVVERYKQLRKEGDIKFYSRYGRLRYYLESRLKLWDISL